MNAKVDVTDVSLETERVLIRPWKKEDLADFYEYAKVDGVGQMAGWNPHSSIEESEKILDLFIEGKNQFALELKENHKVIGSIGLEKLSIDLGSDYEKSIGREIGYVLCKDYWGKGLMPEAVKEVIHYCFEKENYDFLLCSHSTTNNQSKRVIEKCGFQFIEENTRTVINGTVHIAKYYILNKNVWRRENAMDMKQALIQKASKIIQSQCNEYGYCALTLMDTDNRPNTTTITPSKADGIKSMTFCTGYGTRTERIQFRPDACVCFNSPEYHISLKGKMEIITDPDVKREMWYSGLANHFSGPEDPGYVVLKFTADSYTIFIDYQTVRGVIE